MPRSPNHLIVSTRNGTRYLSNSIDARYIVKCKSLDQDKIAYFHYVIQVQLEDMHVSMHIVQMYIVVLVGLLFRLLVATWVMTKTLCYGRSGHDLGSDAS